MRAIAIAVITKDSANGISFRGNTPWPLLRQSADLIEKHTKDQVVIMGRKTWDSIPRKQKQLAGRTTYIISRKLTTLELVREYGPGVLAFSSITDAMLNAVAHDASKKIFIVGGGEILHKAFAENLVSAIYLTDIQNKFDADMFIKLPTNFEKVETSDMFSQEIPGTSTKDTPNQVVRYQINVLKMIDNQEESEYLATLMGIMKHGVSAKYNDIDIKKVFGTQLTFNLENSFPRFTTRQIHVKGLFLEMLWYLRGDSNLSFLHENKIYINNKYATEESHKKNGFNYKVHEIGPCEGYQWRHFGGIDQLSNAVNQLLEKKNATIISWNPIDYPKMAMKPRTLAIQFDINNTRLDTRIVLDTVDMIMQFPGMVSAYSLLALLVAKMSKLQPGKIILQVGTSYIRESHISTVEYETERTPFPFPLVGIKRELTIDTLSTFDIEEDIVWESYKYHEGLTYPTSTPTPSNPATPSTPPTPASTPSNPITPATPAIPSTPTTVSTPSAPSVVPPLPSTPAPTVLPVQTIPEVDDDLVLPLPIKPI